MAGEVVVDGITGEVQLLKEINENVCVSKN